MFITWHNMYIFGAIVIERHKIWNNYEEWAPGVEKRVAEIEAHYTKRAKKLDVTFAAGNNSNARKQ